MNARRAPLPNARWHFQHGPIDCVIGAEGDAAAVAAAHEAAWQRFATVLSELVAELRALRQPVRGPCPLQGAVARRMWLACRPHHDDFITPMAAVAGSVAQELIACYDRAGVTRAWVDNGGDIALHLAPGASVRVGLVAELSRIVPGEGFTIDGFFDIDAASTVRGVATSGWRGRSQSLGIADSVTVLARTAAMADAAATLIANAVDVPDPRIVRRPASAVKDDSDLGDIPVTVDVPLLDAELVARALDAGAARARALQRCGLIEAALLVCQSQARRVGPAPLRGPLRAAETVEESVS